MHKIKVWLLNVILVLCLTGLAACSVEDAYETPPTEQQQQEQQQQDQQIQKTANLTIRIVDSANNPIANTTVDVSGNKATTNENGQAFFSKLKLGNYTVVVESIGYTSSIEITRIIESVQEHTVALTRQSSQQATLMFGGDTMFGRRFMDPNLTTMTNNVPNVSDALINEASAASSSTAIAQYIKPLFRIADFSSVNLESPVLSNPTSVHPTKEFSFFSLPATLESLKNIGVDYVALGNNHVYDYLAPGLTDTLKYVNEAGFLHSGAGNNATQAYQPLSTQVNGISLGLVSATSITGNANPINYIAEIDKGGAADLTNDEQLNDALTEAAANHDFSIVQMHGGDEYSFSPTRYITNRFEFASRRAADLAIAHHPHVAQGFGVYGSTPAVLGLGNLIFDQNRLETLLGVAVSVNIDGNATNRIQYAKAYPIYIEDYQPRLVSGFLSHYLSRRLAEFSDDNVTVIPKSGYAHVTFQGAQVAPVVLTKTVTIQAGSQVIDLRNYAPSDAFLTQVTSSTTTTAQLTLGRDIMVFGDFEDWDNDGDFGEVLRWNHDDDDAIPCITGAYRHQQGMCLTRTQFDNTPLKLPFRQTIRTMPVTPAESVTDAYHELTLFGYAKGDNAGIVNAEIAITTAEDGFEFSSSRIPLFDAASFDWTPFTHHFELPDDSQVLGPENLPARGVNLTFTHAPPNEGEATLNLDELALISWQRPITLSQLQWSSSKMHGLDFLRVNTDEPITLTLSFRRF
ncbi:CapA family protein [Pseudoalteromonas aurantia]|uniref:Capsule biosynthesis protein CapA n=2 Tax=Pseudoalteromonas TaxID=53246 RepID=A0A5S3VCI6_9GAMM|nr:CapA family protein [Pseudoalteromonas aurantia]TMO69265.1 capsule biosynthesis protein CapA [Pseudoalteromonas aurantia]